MYQKSLFCHFHLTGIDNLLRAHQSLFQQSKHCNGAPNKPKKRYQSAHIRKQKVISGYQIRVKLAQTRGRKQVVLSEEEKKWLLTFFDRPDIMYINPGRKDNMYISKVIGIRKYVQKCYLLWKLRDLLSITNGVDIKGMVMAETYRDSFDYELSFTLLYGFIKARKQFVFNRDIP